MTKCHECVYWEQKHKTTGNCKLATTYLKITRASDGCKKGVVSESK